VKVFFWALQQCLGPEYTSQTHLAWRKLFSAMLVVLVPVAVACEQKNGHVPQTKRQEATNVSSYSWKESQRMKNESDKRYKRAHSTTGIHTDGSVEIMPFYDAASDPLPVFQVDQDLQIIC
jgi:hypothetical protein